MLWLYTYIIGFIIFLCGSSFIDSMANIGFRDRVFISSLWILYILLFLILFITALIYSFCKNSTFEEGLERMSEFKIFKGIFK